MATSNFIVEQGDLTSPNNWEDATGHVPPLQFDNVPPNTNYPQNGDGRFWWTGAAGGSVQPTRSLMHYDTTTLADDAGLTWSTLAGSPSISTSIKALGAGSLNLVNGAAITTPFVKGGALDVVQGDFTFECFVYVPEFGVGGQTEQVLWTFGDYVNSGSNSYDGFTLLANVDGVLEIEGVGAFSSWNSLIASTEINPSTWTHVALVRNNGVSQLYIGGILRATGDWSHDVTSYANVNRINIGMLTQLSGGGSPSLLYGYIDEFRISAFAVYTANFTPPSSEFIYLPADAITFIGDPNYLTGEMALSWSISQVANDGSTVWLEYTQNGGVSNTLVQLGGDAVQSGSVVVNLANGPDLSFGLIFLNGTPNTATQDWEVAVAITRNELEALPYNNPDPFNAQSWNPDRLDGVTPNGAYPADTLANLRARIMRRLGFSNQATNPPPGMAALVNDFLFDAQEQLYRMYPALHTRRFFRWKLVPGQRFYSLLDNDDDVLANYHMDPSKQIYWVGVQDTRNVWYPMIEGIPPQLYTMSTKPWRPARYEIRGALEIYPLPDQTYFLWMKANFGLLSFQNDGDYTTIDSNLVFLHALALAKAHYGQPDANNIESLANTYRGNLIAGTHATGHYVPGTIAVPPAVRPTLVQYQDNQGG